MGYGKIEKSHEFLGVFVKKNIPKKIGGLDFKKPSIAKTRM